MFFTFACFMQTFLEQVPKNRSRDTESFLPGFREPVTPCPIPLPVYISVYEILLVLLRFEKLTLTIFLTGILTALTITVATLGLAAKVDGTKMVRARNVKSRAANFFIFLLSTF